MDKPWKVIAAFVAVFMAGAVFGGLFTLRASGRRFIEQPPARKNEAKHEAVATLLPATVTPVAAPTPVPNQPKGDAKTQPEKQPPARAPITPALMRQFQQRLSLTSAQRERIKPIVGRAAEDLQRLRQQSERERQENLADTVRVTDRMYSDVSALLSPDQVEELEKMRAQMQERAETERKHRAKVQASIEAAMKAERANTESKAPAATPASVPTAKPAEKGK